MQQPFGSTEARQALAAAGIGTERKGYAAIARELPSLRIPVRVVYGAQDRVLPDIADTVARVKADVPDAEITALPACWSLPAGRGASDRSANCSRGFSRAATVEDIQDRPPSLAHARSASGVAPP